MRCELRINIKKYTIYVGSKINIEFINRGGVMRTVGAGPADNGVVDDGTVMPCVTPPLSPAVVPDAQPQRGGDTHHQHQQPAHVCCDHTLFN